MTFKEMLFRLRWLLEEPDSSNTRWSTTTVDSGISGTTLLKDFLNQAYRQMSWTSSLQHMLEDFHRFTTSPAREPTSSTNTADSGTSTTQIVDSGLTSTVDDYYNGMLVVNTSRSNAVARVEDYAGSTKTITLDTAIPSQAAADTYYIVKDRFHLPWSVGRIYNLRNATNGSKVPVRRAHRMDILTPKAINPAAPRDAILFGVDHFRVPVTSTLTADASTSSTQIVDAALPSSTDDAYNGWLLVNTTRGLHARILDYTGSTRTATLETSIASQTTGDSYFLLRAQRFLQVYPPPDTAYTLELRHYRAVADLVNDYDVTLFSEHTPGLDLPLVYLAAHLAFLQDGKPDRAGEMLQTSQSMLKSAMGLEHSESDVLETMDPGIVGENIDYPFAQYATV
mgnify:FL=1